MNEKTKRSPFASTSKFISEATITPPPETRELPTKDWATWALLHESDPATKSEHRELAVQLCRDRLDEISNQASSPVKKSYIITTACGHWARGTSMEEAANACVKAGASAWSKAFVTIVLNDPKPEIANDGSLLVEACAEIVPVGSVRNLKSIKTPPKLRV